MGRLDTCDLKIDQDEEVSRTHAELTRVGNSWPISDDGLSRNGTYIGTKRVKDRKVLSDGDAIRVGSAFCVFRDPGDSTITAGDPEVSDLAGAQMKVLVALCRPALRQIGATTTPAANQESPTNSS